MRPFSERGPRLKPTIGRIAEGSEACDLGFNQEHGSRDYLERAPDIYTVRACVYCNILKTESVHARSRFT